jgi:hypothetical protein
MIRDLLAAAAATGDVRDDVPPDELAGYCLHALTAANALTTKTAVRRRRRNVRLWTRGPISARVG